MNAPRHVTKVFHETFGDLTLEIEALADLDQAIDALCDGVDEKSAERVFVEELCPYFGVIWPAARALTTHMARMGGWLKGKTVLEIGCGLALPSLACAKLGAKVTATDFHPEVPLFLKRNMAKNGLTELELKYLELDWRKPQPELGEFDFVIASDVLYESAHPALVAQTLARHVKKSGHVIITDPGRAYLQTYVDALTAEGFRQDTMITKVSDPHGDRAGDRKTHEVFVVVHQKL